MSVRVDAGIELDGTHVAVVTVAGGQVRSAELIVQPTVEQARAAAATAVRAAHSIRASVITEGVQAARVDLTENELDRSAFVELARRATGAPADGTTAAGLFYDLDAVRRGSLSSGLAVVAPAAPVTELYRALASRPVEVVAPPVAAGALDGLSLALRHTSAELTLTVAGHPVAFRQLPSGGLAAVAATLGAQNNVGAGRLDAAIGGADTSDLIATRELERYLRSVLLDVRATLDDWARRGEATDGDLFVYGPGARARVLDVLLTDARLARGSNPALSAALSASPPEARPALVGAYLSAVTAGHGMPQAAFVNPDTLSSLEHKQRRGVTVRRVKVFTTAVALLAGGIAGPIGYGTFRQHQASSELSAAQSDLATYGTAGAQAGRLQALRSATAELHRTDRTAPALTQIAKLTGSAVTLSTVTVTDDPDTPDAPVTARLTGSARTADVNTYLSRLHDAGLLDVTPVSVTATGTGRAEFVITFTLPGGAR